MVQLFVNLESSEAVEHDLETFMQICNDIFEKIYTYTDEKVGLQLKGVLGKRGSRRKSIKMAQTEEQNQQIKVKLVAHDYEFNLTSSGYTPFEFFVITSFKVIIYLCYLTNNNNNNN